MYLFLCTVTLIHFSLSEIHKCMFHVYKALFWDREKLFSYVKARYES